MPDDLLDRFRRRDRLALARLLSRAAQGHGADARARLGAPARPARVVAVTGAGGVGKSTLTGKLIEAIRQEGLTVAVLACDPQSPLSGGALLGDRFRMPARDDDGVFIRSLSAPGGAGALARHLDDMVALLEAYGFDVVLVETVGAGQGDTAVHDLADVVVLLLQPETGDDLQWEKAGVLEVADVVAVHKADLPGAEQVEAQVQASLALGPRPPPAVLRVSSRTGAGVRELWQAALALPLRRQPVGPAQVLLRQAALLLHDRFADALEREDADLKSLVDRWQKGDLSADQASERLLRLLAPSGDKVTR
jgi:2-methylcitrate dehydratase